LIALQKPNVEFLTFVSETVTNRDGKMVAKGQSSAKASPEKALVARLNKECAQVGLFVGSAGSVSVREG